MLKKSLYGRRRLKVKDREPAYTDPEIIDRICEAVIAKLTTDGFGNLPSK